MGSYFYREKVNKRGAVPKKTSSGYRVMRVGKVSGNFLAAVLTLTASALLTTSIVSGAPAGAVSSADIAAVSFSDAMTPTDAEKIAYTENCTLIADAVREGDVGKLALETIVRGVSEGEPEQADIGGELTSTADGDIDQALPANVRLDRISIDAEVTKPLSAARISSVFGFRKNPVTGKYTFHKGLDLAAPGGTEIHAMYSGRVRTASWDKGYGNYVVLDHGGFQTLYGHCSKLLCSAGDSVKAGDVIALVGSTGNSTGNHLHVEFRRDGQRYDPEWILGGIYS